MSYKEHLAEACEKVEGAFACTVMGYDGILVDSHDTGKAPFDVNSMLVEYSGLVAKMAKSGEYLATGNVNEVSVGSENATVAIRPLNNEYFVALVLPPEANMGKARFYLRILGPKVRRELLGA